MIGWGSFLHAQGSDSPFGVVGPAGRGSQSQEGNGLGAALLVI